ncbi:hypothetical protein [Kangiella spongicola]|nr:hypothetical protein [Kangiella spongicola]
MRTYSVLALLVISLILAVIGYMTLGDEHPVEPKTTHDAAKEKSEPAKLESKPSENTAETNTSPQAESSVDGVEECLNQLGLRDDFLNVYKKLEGLGMSSSQLAGVDGYQQVPLESLRSYADANDLDAMYLYGVNLLWKSSLGFYLNENYRDQSLTSEQFSEQVRNHEFNREQFQRGKNYVYKAAVKGKLIGLLEVGLMHKTASKKLAETGVSQSELIEFLSEGYAYLELAKDVYQKDPLLIQEAGLEWHTIEKFIKTAMPDADMNDVMPLVESSIEKHLRRLKRQWTTDRKYYGLEVYPDTFTDEEEALFEKAQSSHCYEI